MTSEDIAGVSAIFDRASLIAQPSSMCSANAANMQTILASGVNTLFVTYVFLQHEMQGPPFSVKKPEERGVMRKQSKFACCLAQIFSTRNYALAIGM